MNYTRTDEKTGAKAVEIEISQAFARLHGGTEKAALNEQRSSLFAFRFIMRGAPAGRDEGEARDGLFVGLGMTGNASRPIMRHDKQRAFLKCVEKAHCSAYLTFRCCPPDFSNGWPLTG
ncbi:hypothetical protein [Paenibacillus konkukensis]|uniref:hypothetical protein n=1 Tax=Paenibacillus konkukensis TaxID=2020716 RepID=UPI00201E4907|nr:hypothetical protein [Paenibacillus konkukensis]